jgi:formylglycine-generating enzyme required for sulfatase activity
LIAGLPARSALALGLAGAANHLARTERVQYLACLSQKTGQTYRLLTQAEWEYCVRAGQGATRFPWDDDSFYKNICHYANGADQSAKAMLPRAGK